MLCLVRSALGDDASKKTGSDASVAAPIQAVAMPRMENKDANGSQSQKSESRPPIISIIPPTAAAHPAGEAKLSPGDARRAAIVSAAEPKFDDLVDRAFRSKAAYGFESDDSLDAAELGEPVPLYTVNEKDASGYSGSQDIGSVLKESGRWLVPVNVNGALRTFIEVSETSNNVFEATGTSVIAARVWKTIVARWPAEKNFHPRLVIHPGIPGYFFTVPEVYPPNMTDIVQILAEVDKPATLSPAPVTLHSWR